jgi:Flp pilus assembly protein TadG
MTDMTRRLGGKLGVRRGRPAEREQGQSMVLIVFALIGIFAFVGLAFDLAWVFVEQIRVSQAADAAALAGGAELPSEAAAQLRALNYLQENGYDHAVTSTVRVILNEQVVTETQTMGASAENALTTIWVDTAFGRAAMDEENTTDRIRVRVEKKVPMTFLQFVGFRYIPVSGVAEAENLSRIDTVIVFDRSGSMEFFTRCYGCWEKPADYTEGVLDEMYPTGRFYPLAWSSTAPYTAADHCASACGEADYVSLSGDLSGYEVNDCNYRDESDSGLVYAVIEAEEYSLIMPSPFDAPGYTYWALQRNEYNYYGGAVAVDAYGRDERGAYLSHHPYYSYVSGGPGVDCDLGDIQSSGVCNEDSALPQYPPPRADYGFLAPIDGVDYYVWVRADGGRHLGDGQHLYWAMDWEEADGYSAVLSSAEDFDQGGRAYDGADGTWGVDEGWWPTTHYDYRLLGHQNLTQGMHTLNIWASSAGFSLDRIIITTDSGDLPEAIEDDTALRPNNGRTGSACNPCDPRFLGCSDGPKPWSLPSPMGGNYLPNCPSRTFDAEPGDLDIEGLPDFWRDEEPIRTALEAAKSFVAWLDPESDQIAYVSYSGSAYVDSPLQCLRTLPGACTSDVFTQTVLGPIDNTAADGSTNIAQGLYYAWKLFESQEPYDCVAGTTGTDLSNMACGRPGAGRVIILMTDGEANAYSGAVGCSSGQDGWPGSSTAFADLYPNDSSSAKDCVVLQSDLAAERGAIIFTISIGDAADHALMKYVAERHGSADNYQWAEHAEDLEAIFQDLYERVFLRLTL